MCLSRRPLHSQGDRRAEGGGGGGEGRQSAGGHFGGGREFEIALAANTTGSAAAAAAAQGCVRRSSDLNETSNFDLNVLYFQKCQWKILVLFDIETFQVRACRVEKVGHCLATMTEPKS